jgi:hypothetical protein
MIPLSSAAAYYVAKVLLKCIILRFGLVKSIISDNGSYFIATIIKDLKV